MSGATCGCSLGDCSKGSGKCCMDRNCQGGQQCKCCPCTCFDNGNREHCKCCPRCCAECKRYDRCLICIVNNRKYPQEGYKGCNIWRCSCKNCIESWPATIRTTICYIVAVFIFALFFGFAVYLYKTKSKAYIIPKAVYEWTGYTSTYSGLGSKNLS